MDTLRGIREHVEGEFGESIVSRDDALVVLGSSPGLGPPDLCWLQKEPISPFSGPSGESAGYYHWVLGRDVSSSAAVAAYFASLNNAVEPPTLIQGLFQYSEYKITRGFYCCYDPFSRLDIRCELCVPGGVTAGAIDANGTLHEVTPELWKTAHVAAFLRSELYSSELVASGKCIHRCDALPSVEAESRLLACVEELYQARVLPAALDNLSMDTARGCTAEHMDLVCLALHHHFSRRQRWKQSLQFFSKLYKVYPAAAVYIAAAQRELDQMEAALSTLSDAIELEPNNCHLITALATECLFMDQMDAAIKLAREAIRAEPSYRPAWLVLARCYVRCKQLDLALITLNIVPTPPVPRDEWETLVIVPPPNSSRITSPGFVLYDPGVEQFKQMVADEAALEGKRVLKFLYGAVMVNREPMDMGSVADIGPLRVTRAVLGAVYSVLQELVAICGWDGFLETRSVVFVMHNELQPQAETPSAQVRSEEVDEMINQLAAMGMEGTPGEGEGGADTSASWTSDNLPPRPPAIRTTTKSHVNSPSAQKQQPPPQQQAQQKARPPPFNSKPSAAAGTEDSGVLDVSKYLDVSADVSVPHVNPQLWKAIFGGPSSTAKQTGRAVAEGQESADVPEVCSAVSSVTSESSTLRLMQSLELQSTMKALQSTLAADMLSQLADSSNTSPYQIASFPSSDVPARSASSATEMSPPHASTSFTDLQDEIEALPFSSPPSMSEPAWQKPLSPQPSDQQPSRDQAVSSLTTTHTHSNACYSDDAGAVGQAGQPSCSSIKSLLSAVLHRLVLPRSKAHPSKHSLSSASGEQLLGSSSSAGGDMPQAASAGPLSEGAEAASDVQRAGSSIPPSPSTAHSNTSRGQQSDHMLRATSSHLSATATSTKGISTRRSSMRTSSTSLSADFARAIEADQVRALTGLLNEGDSGKRLCVRWLDELILALWHDLQAYTDWKSTDEYLLKLTGQTHSGLLLGLPPIGSTEDVPASAAGVQLPARTAGDWLRRGALAERLFHEEDAVYAYRCALLQGPLVAALRGLLRLYTDQEATAEALETALQLMIWHDTQQPFSKHKRVPLVVVMAFRKLLQIEGFEVVQEEIQSLETAHPALDMLLLDVKRWPE